MRPQPRLRCLLTRWALNYTDKLLGYQNELEPSDRFLPCDVFWRFVEDKKLLVVNYLRRDVEYTPTSMPPVPTNFGSWKLPRLLEKPNQCQFPTQRRLFIASRYFNCPRTQEAKKGGTLEKTIWALLAPPPEARYQSPLWPWKVAHLTWTFREGRPRPPKCAYESRLGCQMLNLTPAYSTLRRFSKRPE